MYVLVYSIAERRPGCALLQVAMGGTVPRGIFDMLFPAETWLTAPTPDMKAYPSTMEQLERVSALTVEACPSPHL